MISIFRDTIEELFIMEWGIVMIKSNKHVNHPYSILKKCRDERSMIIR